jgi:hypothetical protein
MANEPVAGLEGALREVDEFLDHNELGLASDWLRSIAEEAYWQNLEILKLLARAESSMGRVGKRDALDARLTQLLGVTYATSLPAA